MIIEEDEDDKIAQEIEQIRYQIMSINCPKLASKEKKKEEKKIIF